jgi:hypothetical protein
MSTASLTAMCNNLQTILGSKADELGRSTNFIQRQRKFTGSNFASSLVFGWLGDEHASLSVLKQAFAEQHVLVSRQALAQRFTARSVAFMHALLEEVLGIMMPSGDPQPHHSLAPFSGIYVTDSTTVKLPDIMQDYWEATEGAGLKLSVCWDLQGGQLTHVQLHDARDHDRSVAFLNAPWPADALFEADLAYFKLDYLAELTAQNVYWLMRYKMGTALFDDNAQPVQLDTYLQPLADGETWCVPMQLGLNHHLPVYLVAQRATTEQAAYQRKQLQDYESRKQTTASPQRWALCDYLIYIHTIPPTLADPQRVMAIARLRWQIELLFRLWKTDFDIDGWRTENPYRILCELYAKLIAALIAHWLFVAANVHHLDKSLIQARRVLRRASNSLLRHLYDPARLLDELLHLRRLLHHCDIASSAARPSNLRHLGP